jgi:hypothetical protein
VLARLLTPEDPVVEEIATGPVDGRVQAEAELPDSLR